MAKRPRSGKTTAPRFGVALGGALLSAALYWTAFPPMGIAPLAFVCLAPLLNRAPELRARRRFLVGWIFGALVHGTVYHWIFHTAQSMSGLGPGIAFAALVAFAVAHGLLGGFFLLALGGLGRGLGRLGFAVVAAGLWTGLEAVFPFLFPWYLGDAFYRMPIFTQAADLGGVHVLSWAAVFCSAYLARSVRPHAARGSRDLRRAALTLAGVVGALLLYGALRMAALDKTPAGKPLRIAVVQPSIPVELKLKKPAEDRAKILRRTLAVDAKISAAADMVVWPEGGFPFYFRPEEIPNIKRGRITFPHKYTLQLLAHVRARGIPLLTGSLRQPHGGRTRNSAVWIQPDGSFEIYDKRKLVPFGERVPFGDTFPSLQTALPGVAHMQAGDAPGVFAVKGRRFLVQICYETIFPGGTRRDVNATDPDLIVNLTNDVWFGRSPAPEHHLMVQTLRAVELRLPLLRVTNNGISALVDRSGRILRRTTVSEATARIWNVPTGAAFSPYRSLGDVFLFAAAGLSLLLGAAGRYRVRKAPRAAGPNT